MTELDDSANREIALKILNSNPRLSIAARRFLGQLAVSKAPLSPKQLDWLQKLMEKAGLEPAPEG